MFKFFKGLGSTGNATFEAARQSVNKDPKIKRLQQEIDDLKDAREVTNALAIQLVQINHIAQMALSNIANQETSDGGQASTMVETAREALKKIEKLEKPK
jgi:Ni,Fe-hydrogenase I large subunit